MQKVYASGRIVILTGFFFGGAVYLPFKINGPANYFHALGPYYFILTFFGVPFLLSVFGYFFPNWVYDEDGFETLYGYEKGKCRWASVKKIELSKRQVMTDVLWTSDGHHWLYVSRLFTRDYLKIMSDVVRYVRKNAPRAEIDPRILKRLNGN